MTEQDDVRVDNSSVVNILDHGFIKLLDHMGNDLTVINSAKVSFNRQATEVDEAGKKLLNYLAKHKHMSPFRHVQLQFHIKAPEFVMRQWYKHIVGISYTEAHTVDHAWNEVSQRYINLESSNFYIPERVREQSENNKQASKGFITDDFINDNARSVIQERINEARSSYEHLIELGVAKEQARMILPLNVYTEVIWSVSLQAVVNFIELRDHDGAQWEIREYAKALRTLVAQVAPEAAKALLGE